MILINCDMGERGIDDSRDRALLDYIDIANLACAGHAGDKKSVRAFRDCAEKKGIKVSAHLSYPDKTNFGRIHMDMTPEELLGALDSQYSLMPDVKLIKFHGALYNECTKDRQLARLLTDWLAGQRIERVIAPVPSELANSCASRGIETLAEAFGERRYNYEPETDRLSLVSRSRKDANIHSCSEAMENVREISENGRVNALVEQTDGSFSCKWVSIEADTICIHSDSEIALELAQRIAGLNEEQV